MRPAVLAPPRVSPNLIPLPSSSRRLHALQMAAAAPSLAAPLPHPPLMRTLSSVPPTLLIPHANTLLPNPSPRVRDLLSPLFRRPPPGRWCPSALPTPPAPPPYLASFLASILSLPVSPSLSQAAARQMVAQRRADPSWPGGAIVTMSSVNAVMVRGGGSNDGYDNGLAVAVWVPCWGAAIVSMSS